MAYRTAEILNTPSFFRRILKNILSHLKKNINYCLLIVTHGFISYNTYKVRPLVQVVLTNVIGR